MKKIVAVLLALLVCCVVLQAKASGYELPIYPERNVGDTVAVEVVEDCSPMFPFPYRGWDWSLQQRRPFPSFGGDDYLRSRRSLFIRNYVDEDTSVSVRVFPQSLFRYLFTEDEEIGGYVCIAPSEIAEIEIVSVMDNMPLDVESIFPYIVDDYTLEVIVISGGKRYEILIRINPNLS